MIRIRVHPQYGAMGGFGMGGMYGGMGNAAAIQAQNQVALAQQQLQNERDTSNLRLQYERALWQEKLKTSQLQSAVQYGGAGAVSPYAYSPYGIAARPMAAMGFGGFGAAALGGLGLGLGGVDMFSTPVF